jgi:hypothetical protein
MKWLYERTEYQDGEHVNKQWFGGRVRANMTRTLFNPGIWFVYFGRVRITINKEPIGLALKKRSGFFYYHFLWWSGQISSS